MNVRDLEDGASGGWISEDALRVDDQGSVWVDLDAPVETQAEPEADLLRIRRNRELVADQSGLRLGQAHLIEVPAEDLAGRNLASITSPNEAKWWRVKFWRPWSYSWTLTTLPAQK